MNSRLTDDASATLISQGFTRREFLKTTGVLVVTFAMGDLGLLIDDEAEAQGINGPGARSLDAWIAIAGDGSVTAYTGKCELGQGLFTAQVQLIAEELCVPVGRVHLIQCDTAVSPDQGTTSGAQSHPTNFNHANLGQAGATAREALLQLGVERLAIARDQLAARDGAVVVAADPSKRVTYGDLIGGKQFSMSVSAAAKRRHPSEWTVLGKPVPRIDLPALVTAREVFVHNVRVPGMLHGRVVRPPAVGATLAGVDESSIRDVPGVVKLVVRKSFVGIVAEKPWQALQAVRKLTATWTPGSGLPSQPGFFEQMRTRQPVRDTLLVNSRDVDATLASAARVVKATYLYPYQAHGSVGASCAVADVQPGKVTIWSATQGVHPLKRSVAALLGVPPDDVRVIFTRGSGCYGINGADTVSFDAALMSQAVGKPVRVELSRKDEMAWDNFGYPFVVEQRAGLDAEGRILVWDYEAWSAARGGRPGYDRPGNVITGMLAGFEPSPLSPRSPAPEPTEAPDNNLNPIPSYLSARVGGAAHGAGTITAERVLSHRVTGPFWTGPLRSPERLQNTFAHECFMDELAATAKADPVAFRLRHLADPRLMGVVRAAARAAKWEARPSPPTGASRTGIAVGRGFACVAYEGHNGYAAMALEAEVNQGTGAIAVTRIVMALDCGPVSNPDGVRNQAEGGALHGISRALLEEVTWDDQTVTSIDWRSYRTFALGSKIPTIDVVLIDQPNEDATGAGETSITVTAAAIGNAVFDATGVRLRQVPFTPERVKAALSART
jgi:nicotinate dehydrogenase subunit B